MTILLWFVFLFVIYYFFIHKRLKYKNGSISGAFFFEDDCLVLNTGVPYPIPYGEIEREFDGQGYGAFKTAVGEAVVEMIRPIQEETRRILADKAYLESVYRAGAEKASYTAEKTLRKVYKKIGFAAR